MLMIICNIGYSDFIARYISIKVNSGSGRNYQDLICFKILTTIDNFHVGYCFNTTYVSRLNVCSYRSRTRYTSLTGFIG